jgi:uncharacterized surface protein with fasciclin (FAS1) repeats
MKQYKSILTMIVVLILAAASAPSVIAAPPGPSIVDVAIAVNSEGPFAGQFDTLVAALLAADSAVLDTLSGNGQFTVFAPTDNAFAAINLTEENIDELNQAFLTNVLLYHVARGRRDSGAILSSSRIRTLYPGFLFQSGGVLTDNLGRQANIIVPDVPAANGIIHVIDAVVLPFAP